MQQFVTIADRLAQRAGADRARSPPSLRISGQYFCFVAEPAGEGLVAKQRPVQVGELRRQRLRRAGGLKAGDRLIVSGIQKIGDGAPVTSQ